MIREFECQVEKDTIDSHNEEHIGTSSVLLSSFTEYRLSLFPKSFQAFLAIGMGGAAR